MQNGTEGHSSIHTIHLNSKKHSNNAKIHQKHARVSTVIMNQLEDARNQVYLQHLEQYYEQLQKIMQENNHRRIKSDMQSFIVFITTQLTLTILNYLIFQNYTSSNVDVLIQIFSIISFFTGLYFVSLHILNFGLQTFLKISFCLDKLSVILISICFASTLIIQILGFSSGLCFCMQFFLPLWFFYSAATVRIQVMNYKWNKFQIIISKIVHLTSFLMVLLLAWQFVYYQKYSNITTNSNSYQIVLIYTIAVSLYFVEFYRLISNFDGTNDLRYEYQFENNAESYVRRKKKELQQKLQLWKFHK